MEWLLVVMMCDGSGVGNHKARCEELGGREVYESEYECTQRQKENLGEPPESDYRWLASVCVQVRRGS